MGVHYFNTNDNDIIGLLSIHLSKVNMSEGSNLIYQYNNDSNELLDTPQPDKS